MEILKHKESAVGNSSNGELSNVDFEAQKKEILRLVQQFEEAKAGNMQYGVLSSDHPNMIKLREAGYVIAELKRLFQA